ncbi:MAG: radical SAM protein [Ruminococcus sp.]|nr:radical SAM protein [Ruminococcus sp.]
MNNYPMLKACRLCPRECGADRTKGKGFCGAGEKIQAAKAYLHRWEEPCISGTRGSGTVFFSGCGLKCVYCQNYRISAGNFGREITEERLAEIFLELQEQGAHNINLVTAAQYVPHIINALEICGNRLNIPVVYNSGGYEKLDTLEMLRGRVSIFIPDMKYMSREAAEKYSAAADYFDIASAAVKKMIEIAGKPLFDENGIMQRGVIIRHMVLPGGYKDSLSLIDWVGENLPRDGFLLSLMSQYTPYMTFPHDFKELNRRVSTFEYEKVADKVRQPGFEGYMQERSSAKEEYTPEFDLKGI